MLTLPWGACGVGWDGGGWGVRRPISVAEVELINYRSGERGEAGLCCCALCYPQGAVQAQQS